MDYLDSKNVKPTSCIPLSNSIFNVKKKTDKNVSPKDSTTKAPDADITSSAFRVTILERDIEAFIVEDIWPEKVVIREWLFPDPETHVNETNQPHQGQWL